jgi:hypothetical protein
MDRNGLLERLAKAEEHIRHGRRLIQEQKLKILRLELRGQNPAVAKQRLEDLLENQTVYENLTRLILRELELETQE